VISEWAWAVSVVLARNRFLGYCMIG